MGAKLGNVDPGIAAQAIKNAGKADGPGLKRIQAAVAKLLTRTAANARAKPKEASPRQTWTLKELGEAWTKGDLARDFPDQIKKRASKDISRLRDHVYPVIGSTRVRDITLSDLERVMASLKGKRRKKLSAGSATTARTAGTRAAGTRTAGTRTTTARTTTTGVSEHASGFREAGVGVDLGRNSRQREVATTWRVVSAALREIGDRLTARSGWSVSVASSGQSKSGLCRAGSAVSTGGPFWLPKRTFRETDALSARTY